MKNFSNYKFNLQPSPIDPNDIVLESIYTKKMDLPIKYSTVNFLQPIRDQGEQGSCSAMTAAAIKEYQEKKDIGFDSYLSPQFVYNLRENQKTEGMTPKDTMKILHKIGIVPEEHYPYNSTHKPNHKLMRIASKLKIKGYGRIHTIDVAKMAILNNGPLYLGLPVYNPRNEMFWLKETPQTVFQGGHAICFIGWDEKGFIGRNSWGTGWGNKGYFHFPYEHWGIQWETWTTIDEKTNIDELEKRLARINKNSSPKKNNFFSFFRRRK